MEYVFKSKTSMLSSSVGHPDTECWTILVVNDEMHQNNYSDRPVENPSKQIGSAEPGVVGQGIAWLGPPVEGSSRPYRVRPQCISVSPYCSLSFHSLPLLLITFERHQSGACFGYA